MLLPLAWACSALAVSSFGFVATETANPSNATSDAATTHRAEWRVSTFSRSTQADAAFALEEGGELVAVWSSRRQQGGRYGVYYQRFDAEGQPVGHETSLNLWTDSHQTVPAIATGGGATWAAWQSHHQDGDRGSIMARRIDRAAADTPAASERLVNQETDGHQSDPVIAVTASGNAIVVWTTHNECETWPRVHGRVMGANGVPLTDEFAVSVLEDRFESRPAVAVNDDGSFAIVSTVADDGGLPSAVRMQRYDGDASPMGCEVDVTGLWRGGQIESTIASTADGYIVAWLDTHADASDYGVLARRFDANGRPLGNAFLVNDAHQQGTQNAAAIAVASDGRFTIAFNSADEDSTGIFASQYDANGERLGSTIRLSEHAGGRQEMRATAATNRLAYAPNGDVFCVWQGDAGLGDDSSINMTLVSTSPLRALARGVQSDMPASDGSELQQLAAAPHEPPSFDPKRVQRRTEGGVADGGGGFDAIFSTGWVPPDPHMAVGPTHIVGMTNGAIAFFTKDGTLTFQDEIEGSGGFWGSVGASGFIFDPEVVYDPMSGRFFAMAADDAGSTSFSLLAVSDDSDPNGTWHKYRFNTTGLSGGLFDSPNIGVDDEAVYITGDGFGGPQPYPVYIYDKASLLAGDAPAVSNSFGLSTGTQSAGIPPVTFDDPPALYMIEHREGGTDTQVRLIALQDPLGSPTITETNLTVPAYNGPEDPPQAGTSTRPETFGRRFWSVAFRNGSLWATHHVNSTRVRARWYEIAMNGWPDSGDTPELVQSGEIDPGNPVRTFFSSITVDDHGNAMINFSRSSPDEFISMATAYRYKSDPLGEFRPMVIHQTNSGPYTIGRWGDYSAVNVDPVDTITLWAHHEYAPGGDWRTWIEPTTPEFAPADLNFDGVVNPADLAILLASWGPCGGCPADLDGDGEVGAADLATLLGGWG